MKRIFKVMLALSLMTALTIGITACGDNKDVKEEKKPHAVELEKLNWSDDNYKAIKNLIKENGKDSKNYDSKNKPYAVFDWDNTTIMNDVEEALLVYQIQNLKFKMTPEELDKVLKTNIPKDNFKEEMNNEEGKPVNIDSISADIVSSYKYLYENYEGLKGNKSLKEIQKTKEFLDFRAKLRYLYAAIGESFSSDVSYPWVTYLFKGMKSQEVAKLTEESTNYWLKEKLARETWESPKELAGKAGVVKVEFERGLRSVKEMQNLYKTLKDNGIEVYICSASYIDVVREYASNPKFGYNLKKDNVFAMVLKKDDNGIIQGELDPSYPQTQGMGKVETIDKFIAPRHGNQKPIMVGGDSNGDYEMLSKYKETKIALIINRLKTGKIGELCSEAINTADSKDRKYFLQGRDNNTGKFIPESKSVMLGEKEHKLKK